MFLFYGIYFEFFSLSVLYIYYSYSFKNTSLYSLYLIAATLFLFTALAFLWPLLPIKNKYILGLNPTNSSISTPPVSPLIFPVTNLFELSWYFDSVQ